MADFGMDYFESVQAAMRRAQGHEDDQGCGGGCGHHAHNMDTEQDTRSRARPRGPVSGVSWAWHTEQAGFRQGRRNMSTVVRVVVSS